MVRLTICLRYMRMERNEKMIDTETWVLPRPRKNKYKGGFPLHFEKKLIRKLGMDEVADRDKILHPFGGAAEFGRRCDLKAETNPDWIADAHDLPHEDNSYKLVIVDPPYDAQQSKELYGTPKPKYKQYIAEAVRVCEIGGYVAMYHWVMTPRPEGTKYHSRIVVLTRVWHRPRVCCIFMKEVPKTT